MLHSAFPVGSFWLFLAIRNAIIRYQIEGENHCIQINTDRQKKTRRSVLESNPEIDSNPETELNPEADSNPGTSGWSQEISRAKNKGRMG